MLKINIYSLLLMLSAICLGTGGYFLWAGSYVPLYLTEYTILAMFVVIILAMLMAWKMDTRLEATGAILGIIAMAVSANGSHLQALMQFGSSLGISVADITMILGFYLFPILYIIIFINENRGRIAK